MPKPQRGKAHSILIYRHPFPVVWRECIREATERGTIRNSERDSGVILFTMSDFWRGPYEFTAVVTEDKAGGVSVRVAWEKLLLGANKGPRHLAEKFLQSVWTGLGPPDEAAVAAESSEDDASK